MRMFNLAQIEAFCAQNMSPFKSYLTTTCNDGPRKK
jgi:hypothetical protein